MINHLSGVLLSHPRGAVQGKTSGGKGAKGGNSLQQSDASDSSTISIISMFTAAAGLRRSASRKPAQTGGNSLQKLCSRNCPHFPCLTFGVHSKAQHRHRLRKLRKLPFLP